MVLYRSFIGVITGIADFYVGDQKSGCDFFMTVQNEVGEIVNFVITPETFFVDQYKMRIGDLVMGFYDANIPVILIYPPQYRALIVVEIKPYQQIKVDYFDADLVSRDGMLKLNLLPNTQITTENGQIFTGAIENHELMVFYSKTTKSIPAQTVPYRIIVLCREPRL